MKSINQKLFALQQEIGAISKDAKNPFFKSSYFDINSLLKNLKPLLGKYKLVLHQPIEKGEVHSIIECVDTNERTKPSSLELPDISDPQKLGSCITYFRRYTLVSLLGLQADDDDGNLASNKKVEVKKEDNRPWLKESELIATLKGTKEQAKKVIENFKVNKEYRQKINKQFNLK